MKEEQFTTFSFLQDHCSSLKTKADMNGCTQSQEENTISLMAKSDQDDNESLSHSDDSETPHALVNGLECVIAKTKKSQSKRIYSLGKVKTSKQWLKMDYSPRISRKSMFTMFMKESPRISVIQGISHGRECSSI